MLTEETLRTKVVCCCLASLTALMMEIFEFALTLLRLLCNSRHISRSVTSIWVLLVCLYVCMYVRIGF